MYYTKATVSAALVAAVNAHMIMKTPSPFDPSGLNNSPLDASGSDFPCKFSGAYTATGGTTNTFALGSDQELSFIGSAVHGGGSCQVVLTYDNPPTKDSKWKVIHSIEGGCPAKGQAGNLPENPDGTGAGTYKYTIPSNIPSGKGVIGWTWFNRIGNREMYMNCGPLELTGTGGSQSNFDALPDMVVLNIGGHPQTPEGVDYKFKDAGSSVENNIGQFGVATCGNDGCSSGDTGGSGSGSGSSSAGSGSSATTSAAASPSSTPAAGNGGGVFLTTGTPASSAAATSTAAGFSTVTSAASSVVATAAPTATPTAAPTSGSGSGSGSSGALSGACSSEGMWNCISGTSYQQCASGLWSAVQPMAAGTKCSPGQNADLGMIAAGRRVRAFRA